MKILQLSDIHLEFEDYRPKEKADILMLNGDICVAEYLRKTPDSKYYPLGQRFIEFFKYCADNYQYVLYIMGNHEHYTGLYNNSYSILKEKLDPRIHILNNDFIDINDYRFVGTTLWTDMNNSDPITLHTIKDCMGDFKVINYNDIGLYRKLMPYDTVDFHKNSLSLIQDSINYDISNKPKKMFVMSHHAPSSLSIHEKYRNEYHMNGGFHSRLDNFILERPMIKYWTHGHMHDSFDYYIGDTRVICNPKGYYNENLHFDESNIIEI